MQSFEFQTPYISRRPKGVTGIIRREIVFDGDTVICTCGTAEAVEITHWLNAAYNLGFGSGFICGEMKDAV